MNSKSQQLGDPGHSSPEKQIVYEMEHLICAAKDMTRNGTMIDSEQ